MTTPYRMSAGSSHRFTGRLMRTAVRAFLVCLSLLWTAVAVPVAAQTAAPGGFLEPTTSTQVRSNAAPTLPARGPFTFPAPYNTRGVRITNTTADCGGADCVDYIGYSYWRNTNNHVGSNTMLIFVTLDRARGGGGPTLFSYDKTTDQVTKVGPIFDPSSPFSWDTGEGWYWSPTQPTKLYVNSGAVLYRYDVNTRQFETVFDASSQFGSNRYIWQTHTSDDDLVHSATLRDSSSYDMLGCMAYSEATQKFSFFAKTGDFDECQIDKSGRWLLIKEQVDGLFGEDNVIVDLQTGNQAVFLDQLGAPGHSDNGYGYMVGEDNWYALPGAARLWQFGQPLPGASPQGLLVYHTTDWSVDLGHVSHANARVGMAPAQQYACASHASRSSLPRANEIVCFPLDGSLQVLVVAPVMTDLNATGGGSDDYSKLPMGNLDITGQYFIWTSNVGTSRQDAFIVKIPAAQLAGAPTAPSLVSAVLPGTRSGQLGSLVTTLATIVASGTGTATACSVSPSTVVPADFVYQALDANSRVVIGSPNTPVNIAAGQAQGFVIGFRPTGTFGSTDIQLKFACTNTSPAPVVDGLNTFSLSSSAMPVPDLVALAATVNSDGIVDVPGASGTGVFSVATANVGVTGVITATADTGVAELPIDVTLCQTDPATGACLSAPSDHVTVQVNGGETPTFGVFVQGRGAVSFDPSSSRVNVRFKDGADVTRGSTSVAVRTY